MKKRKKTKKKKRQQSSFTLRITCRCRILFWFSREFQSNRRVFLFLSFRRAIKARWGSFANRYRGNAARELHARTRTSTNRLGRVEAANNRFQNGVAALLTVSAQQHTVKDPKACRCSDHLIPLFLSLFLFLFPLSYSLSLSLSFSPSHAHT